MKSGKAPYLALWKQHKSAIALWDQHPTGFHGSIGSVLCRESSVYHTGRRLIQQHAGYSRRADCRNALSNVAGWHRRCTYVNKTIVDEFNRTYADSGLKIP
jgi:hypothetical protein